MTLTTNFLNTDHNPAIEQFIKSLVMKTFNDTQSIESIIVNLTVQHNQQVPWKCTIYLTGKDEKLFTAESQAANYLTAFSQALMRTERQWKKAQDGVRA